MHIVDRWSVRIGEEHYDVRIVFDDDAVAPWDDDGHGPVSNWTRRDKRPGEWLLSGGRGPVYRYYDAQEAQRKAIDEGWGVKGGRNPGETDGQYAARAVKADFDRLKAWTNDDWYYVGVIVSHGDEERSLWRIESDSKEYIREVAKELAEELHGAESRLAANWQFV